MFTNEDSNRPIALITYGILTGIGLAIGAAIVGLFLRLLGVRWTTA